MILKQLIYSILLFATVLPIYAQVYHTEYTCVFPMKTSYAIGDTVTAEGIIQPSDPNQLHPYSRYVYIELIGPSDSVYVRQKVTCSNNGLFQIAIPIDYQWTANTYYLRAYSRLMQNFNPENIQYYPFQIGREWPVRNNQVKTIHCKFFPEGGNWLEDQLQNMVFEIKDDQGFPVNGNVYLLDSKLDTLFRTQTFASGLGLVRFHPKADQNYQLHVVAGKLQKQFTLPPTQSGCILQATNNRGRITYQIKQSQASLSGLKLIIYHPGKGMEEIPVSNKQTAGILPCEEEGLYTLFLIDSTNQLLSERNLWITWPSDTHSVRLHLPKEDYSSGEPISFTLNNLPSNSQIIARIENSNNPIITQAFGNLYLKGELSSFATYPLQANSEKNQQEMELWLITAHFTRFSISELLQKGFRYQYPFEDKMFFSGKVSRKNKKPLSGGSLLAYNTSDNQVYEAEINNDGSFTIGVNDFPDGDRFFLQARDNKQRVDNYDYTLNDEVYPPVINHNKFIFHSDRTYQSILKNDSIQRLDLNGQHYLLPEFIVKATIQKEDQVHSERFYRLNYKDQTTIDQNSYITLLDILRDIQGITVKSSSNNGDLPQGGSGTLTPTTAEWVILSNRGPSAMRESVIPILLDGNRVELSQIISMSSKEIASVEYLKPWQTTAYISGALNGAVLISTRGYQTSLPTSSKGIYYTPIGLSDTILPKSRMKAPHLSGEYSLLIDIITPNKKIQSIHKSISVH